MKILLFGKNGQIGWELQRSLAVLGDVTALASNSPDFCGDFKNLDGITQTVRRIAPDIIVNAAAYTAVDQAESELDAAALVNVRAPQILALEAKKQNALLVHYSTDYVFDGSGDRPWLESDKTNPINAYGKTKLEGEQAIQDSGCRHLIFRSSWIHATRGNNFIKTMLRLGKERDVLKVVNDQIGAPTGADLVADVTAHALRIALAKPETCGLYHLAAAGETSWHAYAKLVVEFAEKANAGLKITSDAIAAVPSHEFPLPAKRPCNSRLDTSKIRQVFGVHLSDWRAGVERTLAEILNA